jgi:c-di-AMP phosphodiesterase-like protein
MNSLQSNTQLGGSMIKDILFFFKNAFASKAGIMILLIIISIHYLIIWKYYLKKNKYLFIIAISVLLFFILAYFKWFKSNSDDEGEDE